MMKKLIFISFVFFVLVLGFTAKAQDQIPEIIAVSVDTTDPGNQGTVKIQYKSNTDLAIKEFRLRYYSNGEFRDENLSINQADTLFIFSSAKANQKSEGFQLRTILFSDESLRLVSKEHFTIFLNVEEFNECDHTITIKWNNYIGWGNNIAGYDVWVKKENEPYLNRGTIMDTVFVESDAAFGTTYKFYVVAKSNAGAQSLSNIASYTSNNFVAINPSLFFIDRIVNNGNTVNINFKVDQSVEVAGYKVLTSEVEDGIYKELGLVNYNGGDSYEYIHENANSTIASYYKVQTLDRCNELIGETKAVRKIVLSGILNNNVVSFTWNTSFNELGETFNVLMSVDGSDFVELHSGLTTTSAEVNLIDESNDGEAEYFCFKINAYLPSGYFSESETVCYALIPDINLPNGITPNGDGINDYMLPIKFIKYIDIQNYKFIIYDRFGGKIFNSSNQEDKWDGTINDKPVKEGAYLYYLYLKSARGRVYEKSGSINVVFP